MILSKLSALVGAFADRAAKFVAPATPWIFLGLRRALIPTLCWVILAIMFFVVPQSRDVLHGLSEPPLKSIQDFQGDATRLVNLWALLAYIATSILVALALWYSARLLTTVESDNAKPRALTDEVGSERLDLATIWLPRIFGVSALSSCVGALIYANYTPQLRQIPALILVFAAVIGPILVAVSILSRTRLRGAWRSALLVAGLIMLAAASVLLVTNTEKWRVWVWGIGSALLPAAFLVFLVRRRELLEKLRWDTSGTSATARRFGEVLVTALVLLLGSTAALVVLATMPAFVARGFGSAASLLLFLASTVLLLTATQLLLRHIARDVPGLTTATVMLIAALVARFGDEALGTERLAALPEDKDRARAVTEPAHSPPHADRAYINAFGGGIRAAIFTAEVLAQADDATCGEFGGHIAAASGVSGGSLGIATYLVMRQEYVARGGWKDCTAGKGAATPLTDLVTKALVQDHLSPALARMLAVDAPHFPGSPVRGQALLDSWNGAIVDALEEGRADGGPKPAGLGLRLTSLSGGLVPQPRVYFNSTDADSGDIVWFLNASDGGFGNNLAGNPIAMPELTVGEAVLHSARFPIISPAGKFKRGTDTPRMRLVDGGYADNSGATTLRREFRMRLPVPQPQNVFIDIDGNPPAESICVTTRDDPPILTAVRALLQARSAHARLAVGQLEMEMNTKAVLVQLNLEQVYGVQPGPEARASANCEKVRRSLQAPLGWYVSYGAARNIAASAQLGVESVLAAIGLNRKLDAIVIKPAS